MLPRELTEIGLLVSLLPGLPLPFLGHRGFRIRDGHPPCTAHGVPVQVAPALGGGPIRLVLRVRVIGGSLACMFKLSLDLPFIWLVKPDLIMKSLTLYAFLTLGTVLQSVAKYNMTWPRQQSLTCLWYADGFCSLYSYKLAKT